MLCVVKVAISLGGIRALSAKIHLCWHVCGCDVHKEVDFLLLPHHLFSQFGTSRCSTVKQEMK